MSTKGAFLQQKAKNMAKWIEGEIGKENVIPHVITHLQSLSELDACTLAGALLANKHVLIHRDWKNISALLASDPRTGVVQTMLVEIQHRPHMHDKFWAYIALFIEVAEQ